ncbi:MAG: class I SAM-dependent methyltransferase [Pseudomonadota bacterium]
MNETAARYREVVYPQYLQAAAHPRSALAMAKLFGLAVGDPGSARVLEIACNRGTTVGWIAATLPESRCIGIDIVERAVAEAEGVFGHLPNIAFRQGDVATLDLGDAVFDVIVVQGLFSWVDDAARDGIMRVAGRHLAEGGVALISYNAMPGSAYRSAIRELMLMEEARGEPLQRGLERLMAALPGVEGLSHVPLLREICERVGAQDPAVLRHDDGAHEAEPFYLMQVAEWAAGHGLSYVADSDLALDWIGAMPVEIQKALHGLPRLEALQYCDYLLNLPYRRSIFARAADARALRAGPDLTAALDLHVLPVFERLEEDPETGAPNFGRPDDPKRVMSPRETRGVALLDAMVGRPLAPLRSFLEAAGIDPSTEGEAAAAMVLQASMRQLCTVSLGPPPPMPDAPGAATPETAAGTV